MCTRGNTQQTCFERTARQSRRTTAGTSRASGTHPHAKPHVSTLLLNLSKGGGAGCPSRAHAPRSLHASHFHTLVVVSSDMAGPQTPGPRPACEPDRGVILSKIAPCPPSEFLSTTPYPRPRPSLGFRHVPDSPLAPPMRVANRLFALSHSCDRVFCVTGDGWIDRPSSLARSTVYALTCAVLAGVLEKSAQAHCMCTGVEHRKRYAGGSLPATAFEKR